MIKYILKCGNKHEFESWFSASNEFDKLKKKRLLQCIVCNSKEIEKSIMSPQVSSFSKNNRKLFFKKEEEEIKKVKNDLLKMRNFIEKNFEFVGDKFTKKVRDIYYDKKTNKNIYGNATEEERKELHDEGIELSTIPWVDKDN
tara:strand:+ start:437 stop:865 length:429 start_codon:yes stop_codon:yes gene_type:complete